MYYEAAAKSFNYLEQELVSRQPLNGSEEVGGQTQPLTQWTLLQQTQDLLELGRLSLQVSKRPHGQFELPHVHVVQIEELHLKM